MIYTVLTAVYFAVLLGIALYYLAAAFLLGDRAKKHEFLQNFKKGNFVIVYLVSIPIYATGRIYGGEGAVPAIFGSIKQGLSLVALEYDEEPILSLMQDLPLFRYTVYFCFGLVLFNTLLFAASLLFHRAWAFLGKKRFQWHRGDKLLLIGNNEQNKMIYRSEMRRKKAIVDLIPSDEVSQFYIDDMRYLSLRDPEGFCAKTVNECFRRKDASYLIVVNTKDDARNVALCNALQSAFQEGLKAHPDKMPDELLRRLRIYVFGNPLLDTIYTDLADDSKGCIRYINKYRQIAMDFIDRYPLTQFMGEEQIDYQTGLIKPKVNINVAMLGFGTTNQQIFMTSVANNQFLTMGKNGVELKQVNYLIFDKEHAEEDKNLNHSYYRFKTEFEREIKRQKRTRKSENQPYLPFPSLPAKETYQHLNLNDPNFYTDLRAFVDKGPHDINYIVIGFGTDLENIDMAQKLVDKKAEWGIKDLHIFVKVRNGNGNFSVFEEKDCILIGDEAQCVYHIDRIDDEIITKMAKMRNQLYDMETFAKKKDYRNISLAEMSEICRAADYNWYASLTQLERESNLYACLSLREKLHLLGLDYVKGAGKGLTREEYLAHYAAGDPVLPSGAVLRYETTDKKGKKTLKEKDIVAYGIDFPPSLRGNMAIHEHYRWNSYMISKGFVPASKEEILTKPKNGKDYVLRRHGNLTTFEGLLEFRKMLAVNGKTEAETDVIKYDYQLLDNAYWLLLENGYSIVKR